MSVFHSLDPSSSIVPFPCLGLVQRAHHYLSPSSPCSHSFFVCSVTDGVKDRRTRGVSVPLNNIGVKRTKRDEETKMEKEKKKKRPWCGDIGTFYTTGVVTSSTSCHCLTFSPCLSLSPVLAPSSPSICLSLGSFFALHRHPAAD